MRARPLHPPSRGSKGSKRAPAGRARAALAALLALLCAGPLRAGGDVRPDPEWYRGAVVYGVVPPRFGPEPLKAVTARLDAFRDLGVDALWLAPLNPTDDPGDVSYAITDYFGLRADFGTPEDLRTLVREAHARGLRVLLDFVPNHTSVGHPHHLDAAARGRASPWWGWYDRDPAGRETHYFDWKHLPNLDYGNPLVRQMMLDAFAYWVREYDVDGFRVDAAWGIRRRAPAFWGALRRRLDAVKPGVFLLAEASARDPFYVRNGFDAAYDWTGELGHWAWEKVFDDPSRVGPALDAALASRATPMHRVARFLNNNDTGERFVTRHGLAMTRVAAVLLHALPGIAVVYTGDEVGAEFQPYEEGPPVSWVDVHGLRPLYRRLAALREDLPALRRGAYRRVAVPGHPAAFAFLRDAGPAGRALVVLNFGGPARLRLQGPAGPLPDWDAISERPVAVRRAGAGTLELELGAQEAVILVDRAGRR
ncbi:alpha amylase catalytic region [Anaeromyxobacter sp. K]|uniref:alpha-amylase family glycosyl hydrolase n=1 Tax=Anaeromyxobacter sp. (strain K) TaxID=447217 RepID=UPI00015F8AD8|nr:alpha-amylase family glycosyl hydrolase [Anaeromyxobacter sp. K]ACG74213.1 alpha amylase catalytic region [Anaeromyxobacter sp. K]